MRLWQLEKNHQPRLTEPRIYLNFTFRLAILAQEWRVTDDAVKLAFHLGYLDISGLMIMPEAQDRGVPGRLKGVLKS